MQLRLEQEIIVPLPFRASKRFGYVLADGSMGSVHRRFDDELDSKQWNRVAQPLTIDSRYECIGCRCLCNVAGYSWRE